MNFNKLLKFEIQKYLEILDEGFYTMQPICVKKFTEQLLISKKTFYRYVNRIQALIKDYEFQKNLMVNISSTGYLIIEEKRSGAFLDFRLQFLQNIPDIWLLKQVIEKNTINLEKATYIYGISESSLRKSLTRLQRQLNSIGLIITRADYQLVGSELQIRYFIHSFYRWLGLSIDESTESKRIVEWSCSFFGLMINVSQRHWLSQMVAILLWRFELKKQIDQNEIHIFQLAESNNFVLFYDWFIKKIRLPSEEIQFLYLILQAKFFSFFKRRFHDLWFYEQQTKPTRLFELTVYIMKQLREQFREYPLIFTDDSFISFFRLHLYYSLFKNFSFSELIERQEKEQTYSETFKRLEYFVNEMTYPTAFFSNKINKSILMMDYFYLLANATNLHLYEQKYFICFMTDFSWEKERFLGRQIQQYLKRQWHVKILYARKRSTIDYADILLVTKKSKIQQTNEQTKLLLPKQLTSQFLRNLENVLLDKKMKNK
ncbi:helix-turn-helix domain-containing protein [Melissococcus plutonius]|nr:helix-turn-helix domain-containing protein [Melissococcus plutonius]BAL61706.1 hypothetical protein MPD5_0432 [Melissococcus plutonius DAT561]MCV2498351.1 helix-turn-helix domain-containing protein [Melissococcus plutonius]MCV2500434.1 helix-turn-helix domain-containing protein [Melissococcus plutonius]MCV2506966.1 helix-turn-helix domain-containing protein [Melissococcus plutonius]MCV2519544.1 helix-turn-helix domain-containing protein [Melissococcus plutonius]